VWRTHESAPRHLQWLFQNANVLPKETTGLKVANDLIGRS
jgi:hypothetical protein